MVGAELSRPRLFLLRETKGRNKIGFSDPGAFHNVMETKLLFDSRRQGPVARLAILCMVGLLVCALVCVLFCIKNKKMLRGISCKRQLVLK